LVNVYTGMNSLYARKGELDQAIAVFARGFPLWQRGNMQAWFPIFISVLGYAHALVERVSDAIPLFRAMKMTF
jgi:hypothetical protein